jgi:hypothetical protein
MIVYRGLRARDWARAQEVGALLPSPEGPWAGRLHVCTEAWAAEAWGRYWADLNHDDEPPVVVALGVPAEELREDLWGYSPGVEFYLTRAVPTTAVVAVTTCSRR